MSDTDPVFITLNGQAKRYTIEFQTSPDFERSWQKVLKDAYGHADVRYACRGTGTKRLAVKRYEFSDSYALTKFALSGHEHAADCHTIASATAPLDHSEAAPGSSTFKLTVVSGSGWRLA